MPGTKLDFYLGFLRAKGGPPVAGDPAGRCDSCGAPTHVQTCAACRLLARAGWPGWIWPAGKDLAS
jgi:hypothetical protein